MRVFRLTAFALFACVVGSPRTMRADPPAQAAPSVVEKLRKALTDSDRGVRFAAVQALGKAKVAPDVIAALLEDPEWCVRQEAAWWLRWAGADNLGALERTLKRGTPPARASATWSLSSFGAAALPLLEVALRDADENVRLEALAAVGRMAKDVAAPLVALVRSLTSEGRSKAEMKAANEALGVLEPKPPDVTPEKKEPPKPATEPATPRNSEPPEEPPPDPALVEAKEPEPFLDRIDAVLALAKGPVDADELTKALADPERDIRIAAVIALDRAPGDASARLRSALRDPNARVVRVAIAALGRRRTAAADLAPFLADSALATSGIAREALETIGADAVLPVVEHMAQGAYGVLHHGLLFFETVGAAGAPATATLATMLASDDVNVREIAARCLITIGKGARGAAPALGRALHDPRLCVVANAAIALGRVGLSDEALAAMSDPSARVRAYATFAVGWALGDELGADQAPFEPRLPVLDLGAPGPFPTLKEIEALDTPVEIDGQLKKPIISRETIDKVLRPAIRSKDPAVAVRAAALLTDNDLDIVEAERVMELTLPEGFRDGSPVDFEVLRQIIGCSEVIAFVEHAIRAGRSAFPIHALYESLHRSTRADSIPGLLWLDRNEEAAALDGVRELWQPADRTLRYRHEVDQTTLERDPGVDPNEVAREWLVEFLKDSAGGMPVPPLWALRDFTPGPGDASLLLACAREAEGVVERDRVREDATQWVVFRLLGFLTDERSLAWLRAHAHDEGTSGDVVRAALARRGDAAALRALVVASRDDDMAFALLMEVAPQVATRAYVARLVADPSLLERLDESDSLVASAGRVGVRVPPEALLGVEAVLSSRLSDARSLALAARRMPGCATRRIASRLIAALGAYRTAKAPTPDGDDEQDELFERPAFDYVATFLVSAAPEAALALLRELMQAPRKDVSDAALSFLLRFHDEPSVPALVPWLKMQPRNSVDLEAVAGFHRPEFRALLLERASDPAAKPDDVDEALKALARFDGWPKWPMLNLEVGDVEAKRAAIRAGDILWLKGLSADDHGGERRGNGGQVWMDIGRDALAGNTRARAELWSAFRAGRKEWTHNGADPEVLTFGRDPAFLPHWAEELDSNCCTISDGMGDDVFESGFGMPVLYDRARVDVGRPVSEFVRDWMGLQASRFVWSPLLGRYLPEPE